MDQETIMRASILERQIQEIEQNLEFIEAQLSELANIKLSISDLEKSKDKSIISALSRGIFLKTNLEQKDLLVEVGSGVIVKKSPKETIKVIEEQIEKLSEAQLQLSAQRETFSVQIQELMQQIENDAKTKPSQ